MRPAILFYLLIWPANNKVRPPLEYNINNSQVEKMKTWGEKKGILWKFSMVFHILMQASTEKIKIFGRGNQKLFTFKEFFPIKLWEKFISRTKKSFFKIDWNSGCERCNFWFPWPNILLFCRNTVIGIWKSMPKFQKMPFFLLKLFISQAVNLGHYSQKISRETCIFLFLY